MDVRRISDLEYAVSPFEGYAVDLDVDFNPEPLDPEEFLDKWDFVTPAWEDEEREGSGYAC
jgi:hypothetical protein